ncbi:NUDIX domain-containing protein [Corynebacterium atypicum]|uniref:NUDIX domain-containing protein n=1 Tax=Corynebacterium atypicum TaxID=191610 RepID=UPI0009FBCC7A|nr:NUDIX hydrolase [Corynebacterium atypicum]
MEGDGNGWAAGPDGAKQWALPGGARDSHESAGAAALREAQEETGLRAADVEILGQARTAGPFAADPARPELAGGWSYTTVVARTRGGDKLPTVANEESLELRWVPLDQVHALPLMPAFAASLKTVARVAAELVPECREYLRHLR